MADLVKVVPDIRTLISQIIPPAEFASLYESIRPLTTIAKQHFVEWFSGQALDTIWTQRLVAGATAGMTDLIDGGYEIITGASLNAQGDVHMNGIDHYDPTACVMLWVIQLVALGSNERMDVGMRSNFNGGNYFYVRSKQTETNYSLVTKASSETITSTGEVRDTNFHIWKFIGGSSDVKLFQEGVLKATNSTQLPTDIIAPEVTFITTETVSKTLRIRYCEAYST